MAGLLSELNIDRGDSSTLVEQLKENRKLLIIFGALILIIVYLFTLSFVDPSDTEVIVETRGQKLNTPETIYVDVSGAVKNPGLYKLEGSYRLADAIALAGGLSTYSYSDWVTKNLNLSEVVDDQEKIYVPFEWEKENYSPSVASFVEEEYSKKVSSSTQSSSSSDTNTTASLINVNSATKEKLKTIEGIGETYASRIIENRPYTNIEDLKEKVDISDNLSNSMKDFITF